MPQNQPFNLLIAEDDCGISEMLYTFFTANGINTAIAEDGIQALELVESFKPDVIILDIILPYMDGLSVLDRLRADTITTPVILLTKKNTVDEKLQGFGTGADDYVTKPFSPRVLLARVHAVMRRSKLMHQPVGQETIQIRGLTIDPATREVKLSGSLYLPLTKTEFDLLYFLADRRNMAVSRAEILENILGYKPDSQTKALVMHITNIRKKFELHGLQSIKIQAVSGFGYKLIVTETSPENSK